MLHVTVTLPCSPWQAESRYLPVESAPIRGYKADAGQPLECGLESLAWGAGTLDSQAPVLVRTRPPAS